MIYRKALTPTQASEMKEFLNAFLRASEIAKECGEKPNVEIFMKAWRGQPVTEEGRKERVRVKQREYDRIRREKKRGRKEMEKIDHG